MNLIIKYTAILVVTIVAFTSCRSEDFIDTTINGEEGLKANSAVASLIQRTSLNDGSTDNIIDNANCFTVQLPVTLQVNGLDILVDSMEDFETIEAIFDEFDDDDDELKIEYPITIVLSDFSEFLINNQNEFENFLEDCNGENEDDDDIECIDFQYPIEVTIFNTTTEQTTNIIINSDKEMHDFIDDLEDGDVASIQFPIIVVLADMTDRTVDSLDELEDVIKDAEDDCDEDDDYDFDDDDCINCTEEQVLAILTDCSDWKVDKLELNDNDLEDNYIGYSFNFSNDGTVMVQNSTDTFNGTWSASGSGQNITVVIDISSLPDFNASWTLHEIDDVPGEKKVDLRQVNDDRLRFESTCI